MNKQNNIDKLFEKARNQEVNFSEDKARNLIKNHSENFSNKYNLKNKGVNKMKIIASSIAAIVISVALFLFDNDTQQIDLSNIPNNVLNQITTNNIITDEEIFAENKNDNSEETKVINQENSPTTIDETNNELKYIKLNKNELSEIGVKIINNNAFEFNIPSKNIYIKYRISLDEGIKIEEFENNAENKNYIPPTFITHNTGEKIFGRFESDDNSMHMYYSRIIKYNDSIGYDKFMDYNITHYLDENDNSDLKYYSINKDSINLKKQINVVINTNDSVKTDKINVFNNIIHEEMTDSLLNPENSEILIRKVFKRINGDSTLKKLALNNNGFNLDVNVQTDTSVKKIKINEKNIFDENIRVNKLLPIAYTDNNEIKYIFWFDPNVELIKKLPEKYQENLLEQFNLINSENYCETVTAGEDTYFDILRSCDGKMKDLAVYPNPTEGALNIKFYLEEQRELNIAVYDASGEKVKNLEKSRVFYPGDSEEMYDISELNPGLYVISIISNEGEQIIQRVIKK